MAASMAEGLGRMREEKMDVIVLDANFDPVEQGVAFITREVRLLRPSERRRLFLRLPNLGRAHHGFACGVSTKRQYGGESFGH